MINAVTDISQIGKRRRYRPIPVPTESDIRRFCSKVSVSDGCWIWTSAKAVRGGYGVFGIRDEAFPAHRVAYAWLRGNLPTDLVTDHLKCDNPQCVNPYHLKPSTIFANTRRAGAGVPLDFCRKGLHSFPEHRKFNSAGQSYCGECKRQRTTQWARNKNNVPPERYRV